jgi:hypothetical protein
LRIRSSSASCRIRCAALSWGEKRLVLFLFFIVASFDVSKDAVDLHVDVCENSQ